MIRNAAPDEIAEIARGLILLPDRDGVAAVEARIAEAEADDHWDEVGKWHRVRLRLIRYQRERARYALARVN